MPTGSEAGVRIRTWVSASKPLLLPHSSLFPRDTLPGTSEASFPPLNKLCYRTRHANSSQSQHTLVGKHWITQGLFPVWWIKDCQELHRLNGVIGNRPPALGAGQGQNQAVGSGQRAAWRADPQELLPPSSLTSSPQLLSPDAEVLCVQSRAAAPSIPGSVATSLSSSRQDVSRNEMVHEASQS